MADGNSVILVDYDTQILGESDWLIEKGPEADNRDRQVIADGTLPDIMQNPASQIGPFFSGKAKIERKRTEEDVFAGGKIHLSTGTIHTRISPGAG